MAAIPNATMAMNDHHHSKYLLLEYDASIIPEGGSIIVASLALTYSYFKDPAGHSFHQKALKQAGLLIENDADNNEDDDQTESESTSLGPSREGSMADFSSLNASGDDDSAWKHKRNKKTKKKKRSGVDLYALLGLQHERWMATEVQMKAAYRKSALEHHPDKQRAVHGDDEDALKAAEERFKAIQEAYETLSDPVKRREYDSLDTFDDSLPGEQEATSPELFFKHFGAAFMRNAKWSVDKSPPTLGSGDADMKDVDTFYDFWFSFKSWREFPHPDEEDVEAAESREERRWIERYNTKLREKGKKEEFKRLRDFVELAQRLDPRIRRRKEEQRAERERLKAAKEAERERLAEEERKRKEEEERKRAEEEAAAAEAKKQRQVEKKALQKERARLRKLCGISGSDTDRVQFAEASVDSDQIELLCSSLDLLGLNTLCEELLAPDATPEGRSDALSRSLARVQLGMEGERRQRQEAASAASRAAAEAAREEEAQRTQRLEAWSEEEVRLMKKAMDKFPLGTNKRWETIQAYVRTRTLDEVLEMAKHGLKSGKYAVQSNGGVQITKKRQGNTVIKSEATQRVESFTDLEVNLRGDAAQVLGQNEHAKIIVDAHSAGDATTGAPPPPPASSTDALSNGDVWNSTEELALVKALKEVPKDASDRWEQVSAAVGTKSKAACARRFKEMKQSYKAKKEAPS